MKRFFMNQLSHKNKVLNEQERTELCSTIDGFVKEFSESIDAVHKLAEDIETSENEWYKKTNREFIAIGIFVAYCFCDISLMTKQFVQSSNPYERAFLRGKLQVLLNESFKKLYDMVISGKIKDGKTCFAILKYYALSLENKKQ